MRFSLRRFFLGIFSTVFLCGPASFSCAQDLNGSDPKAAVPTPSKVVCIDSTKPRAQVPPPGPQCAEEEFAKRGKPVMSPAHNGVAFGISSAPGNSMTVNVWMDNQTDRAKYYYMCCRSSFLGAVEVYDSSGHRLLSKQEQAEQKACTDGAGFGITCSCSTWNSVAPHTLQVVDSGDLADGYVFSPGRYFIAPASVNRSDCESLSKNRAEAVKPEPENAITVVIPEK